MSFKPVLLTCSVLISGAVAAAQEEALTPLMKSAVATVLTQIPGDRCTAPQPKPFPGEMKFYHTFHPTDSYYETWCKIQMFRTSGLTDVTLDLVTDEHRQRLATWRDSKGLDGQPTGTNQWFATEWVRQVSRFANSLDVAAFFWRATKQAKDFGVPADSEQGAYRFYTGDFVLTMSNLDIMGVKFMVQATLSADLGLVQRRLAEGKPGYPEFEMFSPEDRRKLPQASAAAPVSPKSRMRPPMRAGAMNRQAEPTQSAQSAEPQPGMGRVVGFPMRLGMVTIYSDDPAIKSAGPEIKKAFLAKYAKFVGPAQKDPKDPGHVTTRMTDKFVSANLHEGVAHENGRAYIQVNYLAADGGSLDLWRAGAKSLSSYGAALAEKARQAGATKAREKKGENSDF